MSGAKFKPGDKVLVTAVFSEQFMARRGRVFVEDRTRRCFDVDADDVIPAETRADARRTALEDAAKHLEDHAAGYEHTKNPTDEAIARALRKKATQIRNL